MVNLYRHPLSINQFQKDIKDDEVTVISNIEEMQSFRDLRAIFSTKMNVGPVFTYY